MNRETNRTKWQDIINEWAASGQTQAHWCAENDVNIHNFRYWKRCLSSKIDEMAGSDIGFVSLSPTIKPNKAVTVRIGSAAIEVDESVNLSLLEDVVKVLIHYA